MIDIDVIDLDRDGLPLRHRVGILVCFWNVISELFDAVWIAEIHHADAGVEVCQPRNLVLEPIDLSVDRFGGLVRTEASTFVSTPCLGRAHLGSFGAFKNFLGHIARGRQAAGPVCQIGCAKIYAIRSLAVPSNQNDSLLRRVGPKHFTYDP